MQAKWVFEKDAYEDGNTERMIAYCKAKGIPHQLVPYVAFGSDAHIKWAFGPDECVITYGTIHLAQFVQKKKAWYPGVWCDWHQFKCSTYLSHLGQFSVQDDYAFLPIAEVHRRWNSVFARFESDGHVFIKPDDNDKRFHGEKVSEDNRDKWYEYAQFYGAPKESLALVARPSHINAEWRLVVANRKIVTGSMYKADGRTTMGPIDPTWQFDRGAMDFADEVIASTEWQPAPIYALDVCMTEDEKYRLMEVGSVNCCGLYSCDVEKVIDAASELALKEWDETHGV